VGGGSGRAGERNEGGPGDDPVPPLVAHLFRRSAGRLVASLTAVFGPHRLDLAEEVVQDALLKALQVWPFQGVPGEPEAWIYRVARNRALDVLRREGRNVEEATDLAALEKVVGLPGQPPGATDDELSMIFMCCHPSLPFEARVALTLRTVGGLSTDEIARAFLTSRATVQQRIVRAKRAIGEGGVPIEVPGGAERTRRLESVMAVAYLLFNEGYATTQGENLVRSELCGEAIRLTRLLARHPATSGPDVDALLALMLLQASRLPARSSPGGELVLLRDQDRALWDRGLVAEGLARMTRAMEAPRLTRYHVEAGIAATHAAAPSWEGTPWDRIVDQYDLLMELAPSPVVAVNRAVAVAMAGDVDGALVALDRVDPSDLGDYYLLPATRGRLLGMAGRRSEAVVEYRRALLACRSEPVRRLILTRIDALEDSR